MNRVLLLLACFIVFSSQAQTVPPSIAYQAIARNASGQALVNAPIAVQFRIFNTVAAGSPSYQEIHNITTDNLGYFNLKIGTGSVQIGTVNAITWSTGDVSYETWMDVGAGLAQVGGRVQFASVPYALFAGNASAAPSITINSPNTVNSPSANNYVINVPTPTLAINSNQLSISNGNTVTLPSSPVYMPGPGVTINSGTITNTAPDQVVTLTQGLNTNVTGAYPNYTVDAVPTLSINSNQLSISNGNTVILPTGTTYSAGPGVAINSGTITNTMPDQVVALSPGLNTSVSGTYPSYTVNATPTLSLAGNNLSISNGNSVTLPSPPVLMPGTGIAINSGTITNTAPDQVISLLPGANTSVLGSYPNYTVNATPNLSLAGNNLSISNGNSVTLPAATSVLGGANVTVNQAGNVYTVASVTPTLSVAGNIGIGGSYPNQTITVPLATLSYTAGTNSLALTEGSNVSTVTLATPAASTLTGTGLASVTNSSPNYTVSVPTPTMGFNNATGTYSYTQGAYSNTINLSPNTTFSSGTLTVGSNTAVIPGTGIWTRNAPYVALTTSSDNVGIGTFVPSERLVVMGNVSIPNTNQYKYQSPKTDYYVISALDLNTEGIYHRQGIAGGVYITDGTAGVQGNFYAGVHLPQGATINTIDAYVVDNDGTAGRDIDYVQLWRNDGAVGTGYGNSLNMGQTNGTTVTSSVITKLTTSTITSPLVDNVNYSYYVRVGSRQADSNLMIFKIVITYTVTGTD